MSSNKSTQPGALNEQELIKQYSKEELAMLFIQERKNSAKLQKKNKELKQRTTHISSEIEAQQQFIANKLMKRLKQVQEQKQILNKRLMQEEENITYNLKKRLKELIDQKVEMENQLEQEQQYMTNKLSQQLRQAIQKKDILQKKLESQKRIKQDLNWKIQHQERIVKKTLLQKLQQLQKDKIVMENQFQAEGEYMLNTIRTTIDRIVSQKNNLQHQLSNQVKQKQDIVLALEKQKTSLTKALQKKIKQIKRDKKLIKSHIKASAPQQQFGSNQSTPRANHIHNMPKYYSSTISMTNKSTNCSRKQSQSQTSQTNTNSQYNMMMTPNAANMSQNEASQSQKSARNSSLGKKYIGNEIIDPNISTPGSSKPTSARKLNHDDDSFQNSSRSFNHQFDSSIGPATPKDYEETRLSIGGNSCTSLLDQQQCGDQLQKFFENSEQRLEVLQRDKQYYERRHSAMMRKIMALSVQLNTQRQQARKCEYLNSCLTQLIDSQLINKIQKNTPQGYKLAKMLQKDQALLRQKYGHSRCDVSVDSFTDSSIVSVDSSFSMQSDDKISLRGSIESNQDNQLMQAIRQQNNNFSKPM